MFFSLRLRQPPTPTLFPYTTLFRSQAELEQNPALEEELRPDRDAIAEEAAIQHMDPKHLEPVPDRPEKPVEDRKSTRLNSSHEWISYAVFCLKKKKKKIRKKNNERK